MSFSPHSLRDMLVSFALEGGRWRDVHAEDAEDVAELLRDEERSSLDEEHSHIQLTDIEDIYSHPHQYVSLSQSKGGTYHLRSSSDERRRG